MVRWVPTFLAAALIVVLLGFLETVLVAAGVESILFVFFLLLLLSPLWLTTFIANAGEKGEHERPNHERLLFPFGK